MAGTVAPSTAGVSLVLCVGTVVLWVRSYTGYEVLYVSETVAPPDRAARTLSRRRYYVRRVESWRGHARLTGGRGTTLLVGNCASPGLSSARSEGFEPQTF